MMQGERDKLLTMEDKFTSASSPGRGRARGRDAIRRSRAAVRPEQALRLVPVPRPHGRRQDELCKALAAFLFDSEDHLIRIDMSNSWRNTRSRA